MTSLSRDNITGINDSLLVDCVLNMGKRGSGKSSTFRLAMERALTKRIRCGWVDAMGIGWGIAVAADGKTAGYPGVVVFGGEHGHLQIHEKAGKALGTTLAKANFSWVLDLKGLPSKAARVRFMSDFVEAIYEHCEEPLLLFMDEIDLWAPQMILDKQGPSAALLGAMHELVRRGRVKGLSVWMATQRPAEVSKGIISQADALFTFKLMAPQDLDAAMSWMKGHIGKEKASEWASRIPGLKKGEAIVYVTEPEVKVTQVQFPMIATLDTFSPPKKGQAAPSGKAMAKVDLEAISSQIGAIEEDLKANDPKLLHEQIRALKAELAKKPAAAPAAAPVVDVKRESDARARGYNDALDAAEKTWTGWRLRLAKLPLNDLIVALDTPPTLIKLHVDDTKGAKPAPATPYRTVGPAPAPRRLPRGAIPPPPVTIPAGTLSGPERKIMTALAEWKAIGFDSPTREQVAIMAGYHMRTGSFLNALGSLRSEGLIEYGTGTLFFTPLGFAKAPAVDGFSSPEELHRRITTMLDGPQDKVFQYLLGQDPGAECTREEIAAKTGYHIRTGSFLNALGRLRTLTVVEYGKGTVFLRPWVFMEA